MSAMMPPQSAPAAAPQQQPTFPTPEDVAQIQQATGFTPQKIMQDIQSTGAQSADELMSTYSQQGGVDPSTLQGASGMPAPAAAHPMQAPVTASGPRGMAQAAMRGEPMPDESESAGEMGQEAMSPGAEMAEGIQPNVAMAAHAVRRPAPMHRAMKGKPAHHAQGRGRRV